MIKRGSKKYFIPFIVIFLFVIILTIISQIHINSYYVKVGDVGINKAEYSFFYNLTISKFKTDYSDYINYMNIDLDEDLSTQYLKDDISWEDYFISQTDSLVYDILSTVCYAKENNYEYDATNDVDEMISYLVEYSELQNISYNEYIKYTYDKDITERMIKKCCEYYLLYNKYINENCNTELSENDYEDYYPSNKDSLDCVDYYIISQSASDEEKLKETMLNINSLDEFKEKAIEIQGDMGYNSVTGLSNCNTIYANWLFNTDDGTMNTFVDNDNDLSFLIYKVDRHRDETLTKNIYIISLELTDDSDEEQYFNTISEIEEAFDNTSKTEKDFINVAKQYSVDAEKQTDIAYSQISPLIGNWLYSDIKKGDTTIIKTSDAFNLIYYNGDGIETYKSLSKQEIVEEKATKFLSNIKEKYTFLKKNS